MATILNAFWSKLEAVNEMLRTIGEDPVNSLTSGLDDAELAEQRLEEVSRQIQTAGWSVNTDYEYTLTKDASTNRFWLPKNTLFVDTTNPSTWRTPLNKAGPSAHFNVVMRRDAATGKLFLRDADKNSDTWPDAQPDKLLVKIVYYLEFDDLSPHLQFYIGAKATRKFQDGALSSQVIHQYTQEDELDALSLAQDVEAQVEDLNPLYDNPQVHAVAYRNNDLWRFTRGR